MTLKLLNHYKPIGIFNLAAETHVDRSIDNPDNFIKSNILGLYNLLSVIRKYLKKMSLPPNILVFFFRYFLFFIYIISKLISKFCHSRFFISFLIYKIFKLYSILFDIFHLKMFSKRRLIPMIVILKIAFLKKIFYKKTINCNILKKKIIVTA